MTEKHEKHEDYMEKKRSYREMESYALAYSGNRVDRQKYGNGLAGRIRDFLQKEADLERTIEGFGLMKGQKVKRHIRTDPRTGQKIVAGTGGTGSPESVLAEGKTVAPNIQNQLGDAIGESAFVNPEALLPETSIRHPSTMETIVKNISKADSAKLTEMFNTLFEQEPSEDRGFMAELMLKEVARRGFPESGVEEELNEKKQQEEEEKKKEKEKNDNDKRGPNGSNA